MTCIKPSSKVSTTLDRLLISEHGKITWIMLFSVVTICLSEFKVDVKSLRNINEFTVK